MAALPQLPQAGAILRRRRRGNRAARPNSCYASKSGRSDPMHAEAGLQRPVRGYYCDNYLRLTKESGEFFDVPY
jgi:hypothetical protein